MNPALLTILIAFCLLPPALSSLEDDDSVTIMMTLKEWTTENLPALNITGSPTFKSAKKIAEDWKVAGTAAASVVGSAVTSTLGTAAGFTAGGILKGSLAATFQSYFGTGVVFSTLQSIGATGGMAMLGTVGWVGGAVAGVGYYVFG